MVAVLIVVFIVFVVGFLIGWGTKSDIKNGYSSMLPEDKVVNEMKLARAADYVNNPIVRAMRDKEQRDFDK